MNADHIAEHTPTPLIVGLPGTVLDEVQLAVVERVRPAGVILFARNVASTDQVRDLVASLRHFEPRPFVCVDLEGGMVNRLESLWGPLPSPAAAARAGVRGVQALGDAAGAACRSLGIHLDLAPVVDLERPNGLITGQGRTLGRDAERTTAFARAFAEAADRWGVASCLKHFPGLGAVETDTHHALPTLDHRAEDLDDHIGIFAALSADIPIIMVGHVLAPVLGDPERPSSLSRSVVQFALELPGRPVVISDDLEMGALADQGRLPDLVVAALRARNHGVLVCRAFDSLGEISERLDAESGTDPTFAELLEEAGSRMGTLARDLCRRSAAVPAPDDTTVAQLWAKARKTAGE